MSAHLIAVGHCSPLRRAHHKVPPRWKGHREKRDRLVHTRGADTAIHQSHSPPRERHSRRAHVLDLNEFRSVCVGLVIVNLIDYERSRDGGREGGAGQQGQGEQLPMGGHCEYVCGQHEKSARNVPRAADECNVVGWE